MASVENIIDTYGSNIILCAFAFSVQIISLPIPFFCCVYGGQDSNLIPFSPSKPTNVELLYSLDPMSPRKHMTWNPCVSTHA